ncbi:MAG: hypothetical protein ACYDA9_02965 [Terriglobia bacterium]
MKNKLVAAIGALAVMMIAQSVRADTLVSTINGYYDVDAYDSPSLHISNSTLYSFSNVHMTLTGYQGLNNGKSESVSLSDILAGGTQIDVWGSLPGVNSSTSPGNLSAYDYDDEYVNSFNSATGYGLSSLPNNLVLAPQCAPQSDIYGWNYCADTGNFYVTITATWNNPSYGPSGTSIYSQFSPDPNLAGAGNAAGTFVGWEGLDPNGWSETTYDSHSNGGPNGVLANIYVGSPPPVSTPEPGTLSLLGTCIFAVAGAMRRKWLI